MPDSPSELYGYQSDQKYSEARAIYHIIGKILSGPEKTIFHENLDAHVQNYVTIREEPWFSVRVLNANESFVASPSIDNVKDGDIIALDFRFNM